MIIVYLLKEAMRTVNTHCSFNTQSGQTDHTEPHTAAFRCCLRWKTPHVEANLNITMVRARYLRRQECNGPLCVRACVCEFFREMKETAEGL